MYFPCMYFPYDWMAFACFEVTGYFLGFVSLAYEIVTEFPVVIFLAFLLVLAVIELRKLKEKTNG
ncbi:Uncharacterised protein [Ectopseudomonas mendocina]|uniref:Uncharacterized protein n=1 Tax=Ectopseudomonas mendocina TaxID=300 RepID=A0A379PRW5_ECTME|nr:hypothetical protein [Pseudomonas mendocina]SUE95892.1 Uncharacterised protein [Pseudomonas mendocina]